MNVNGPFVRHIGILLLWGALLSGGLAAEPAPPSADQVQTAMKRAATYFHDQVAVRGGYVYFYTLDLQRRFGEGEATSSQVWVQPPGTPTVGMAYLTAFEATGDQFYLQAADEAAEALIYGQLESGGWTNCIDFDPQGSRVARYRGGNGKGRNVSSLDDDQSQSAMRFLIRLDAAHDFQNNEIHQAATIALDALLAAQFANGAFPQGWEGPVDQGLEVVAASFPAYDWRTEGRIKNYWDMYTLNDGAAGTISETLIVAHEVYQDERYLDALRKLGDFLILAQMPQPQPAWAQQYNFAMHPIWARKFEPPAIAGRESEDVLEALLTIYETTGDAKYLQPIPAALEYFRRSLLADGQLARYYELQTNRPLYMQRKGDVYSLTYDDTNLPSHYAWKSRPRLDRIEARYQALLRGEGARRKPSTAALARRTAEIVGQLDNQGRWVSTFDSERLVGDQKFRLGDRYLSSKVFSDHLTILSDYLTASR